MDGDRQSRRSFLAGALGAAAMASGTAALAWPVRGGEPARAGSVRLGGPIFLNSDDPEALALEHRRLGYRAAYCPRVSLTDGGRIRAITEAFRKHDVVIAEVGRWVNLLDADPAKRKANLQTV